MLRFPPLGRRASIALSGSKLQAQRAEIRRCETYRSELEHAYLTDDPDARQLTASPIATLTATDLAEAGHWLRQPVVRSFGWRCAPVYRDALAFHAADGRLLSVLNLRFPCDRLLTEAKAEVPADTSVYRGLKSWLQQLGQPIPDRYAG